MSGDLIPEEAIRTLALKVNPWIGWESVDGDDCGAPLDHLLEHEGGWGSVLEHYSEVRRIVAELAEGLAAEVQSWAVEFALIAGDGGQPGLKWCAEELAARASVLRGEGDRDG